MIRFPIAMLVRLEWRETSLLQPMERPPNSPGKQSSRPVEPTMGHVQSCSLRVFVTDMKKIKQKKTKRYKDVDTSVDLTRCYVFTDV